MKVQQEILPFRPITIKLETMKDAKAFFGIIDKVEAYRCHANSNFTVSEEEAEVIVKLSNAITNRDVRIR